MKTRIAMLATALAVAFQTATALAVVITTNTSLSPGDLLYDGQPIVVSNCTLTVNGVHSFASLLLTDSAVLTHSPAPAGETNNRLDLAIAGELTIDATSRVDVNAKGYGLGAGPGAATNDMSGGGHGGPGGTAHYVPAGGVSYGDLLAPTVWGSGGGGGGAGGGWVRLGVGGVLTVAGQLTANGESAWWSGGAGGSILVSAGTLAGAGTISAKGGDCGYAMSGGGGGGRIAMYYGSSSFSGALSAAGGLTPANAFGGLNGCCGGAGTLYTKANSQSVGDLLLDNSGRTNAVETPITAPVAYRLTLTNATAYVTAPLTLTGLRVSANGLLTHPFQGPHLQVLVQGNAVVEGGGAVGADARGYPGQTGPGKGSWLGGYYGEGSGAGHGGQGGACWSGPGGVTYDSETEPVDFGSGGGGGSGANRGGGAIQLTVAGTLTIDGRVSVNGDAVSTGYDGGGAGGSIHLTVGTLAGAGTISAKGGDCGYVGGGGGGGGRIAMYYGSSSFSGALSAAGGLNPANGFGNNGCCGAAGTLYTKANSQGFGDLLLDNSGRTNAMETLITAPVAYRLTLTNVTAYATAPLTLTGLRVSANGLLTHPFQGPRLQVLVQGNAVVEGGGAIGADARGYPGGTGPGKGSWLGGYYGEGSGAGHGGQGGACWDGGGGVTYDSETEPVDFGSGGGGGAAPNRGGGAIQLTIAGTLTIDGRVSVNADAVTGGYDGGGSGGSVWLTASRLDGAGTITANGQVASYPGAGSGGGGRIAIYTGVNEFAGTVAASGGQGGLQNGSSGSLYYSTNVPPPMVIAQYPSGSANRFVSYVDVTFNQAVDPDTFTTNDVIVTTPAGPIPASQITLSGGGGVTWRIGFPTQMANGAYSFTVGPHIANLFGQEMAASYSGGFTVNFTTPTTTVSQTGGNLSLIWPSATGLSYQLQSATNLPAASWLNEGAPLNGTGGLLTNSLPIGAQPRKFFRFLLLEN